MIKYKYIEYWKPVAIKEYKNLYSVSNLGRVKAIKKQTKRALRKNRIRKECQDRKGYCYYGLIKNGKKKNFGSHVLVMLTFVGPKPLKREINHKDGNKKNNKNINLEYVTRSYNQQHAYLNGLHTQKGVTKELVLKIRKLFDKGYTVGQLATKFKKGNSTISYITRRITWKGI
jgi:hypothetical protein